MRAQHESVSDEHVRMHEINQACKHALENAKYQ